MAIGYKVTPSDTQRKLKTFKEKARAIDTYDEDIEMNHFKSGIDDVPQENRAGVKVGEDGNVW